MEKAVAKTAFFDLNKTLLSGCGNLLTYKSKWVKLSIFNPTFKYLTLNIPITVIV